ncbi:MAG: patatin-like phospholipase family protein [Ramlibacter sp.]|jgi:NTE family protein|nr:patatin-like phospholipase family protein [Ramlibacter sp.]
MRRSSGPVVLNLALQGGGAHGAFTWGVLDRLLDEPGVDIGRISGSSAGALNGAALATGYARDGRAGAKANLALLWQKVAEAGSLMTFLFLPLRKPGMGIWDDAMPLLSPYQTNPLGMGPLRYVLERVTDVALLKTPAAPALFVNAVDVHTGYSRVFGPGEVSVDALLASSCAPLMFQAVQIDGRPYWDGSYGGNPMLWPLYQDRLDTDIFMIELTPLERQETPMTAKNILNRINEIASINGLVAEMRALDLLNRQAAGAAIRMHVLSMDTGASQLDQEPSIKRTVGRVLFERLRHEGYANCDSWLSANRGLLGVRSSVDVRARYLAPYAQPPGGVGTQDTRKR